MTVYLTQFFKQRSVTRVTEELGFEFRDWMSERLAPITARERICLIRSCWQWGMRRGLVKSNPWLEVKVKVPPKQKPRPFNKEEVEKILEGFRTIRIMAITQILWSSCWQLGADRGRRSVYAGSI